MANHDTESTTATLECVLHDVQGLDTHPTVNQAHSSPAPRSAVVENDLVFMGAANSTSTHSTLAIAESSSAGNEAEIPTSPNITVIENNPEINDAGSSSDVVIAAVENSPPATEPVEVFRFTDLASEIRNRIYRFVLGPPQDPSICLTQVHDDRPSRGPSGGVDFKKSFRTKSVVLNPEHKDPKWGVTHQVNPHDLSILLVSKQIYVEAFHVFYTTNCFSFADTGLLYRFLKNIGYIRRQHLTMIYFLWRGPDAKEAFRLLKTCRRLRIVQFTVPCSHPPGYEALKEVRVETAKARALVHFGPAQSPPLNIHDHTSCFGDYQCHCLCRRAYEPASNIRELETAMMRPRLEKDLPNAGEKFNLFKPKRENFKKSEEQDLLQEKASFDDFISRFEQQGKELRYLGRRNKTKEAALNQTLTGADFDDYFRDLSDKLAEDRRRQRYRERWHAKRKEEKETKEREEREYQEAKTVKESEKNMRRVVRELKQKFAREAKESAKKEAKEARQLKWRLAREAKEREKMMAADARAQKKAAKEAKEREKVMAREARAQKKAASASSE